jgi:hypothetical protein
LGWKEPAAAGTHEVEPLVAELSVPAGQGVHAAAPGPLIHPFGQGVQDEAPAVVLNVPLGHAEQAADPLTAEAPCPHRAHDWPLTLPSGLPEPSAHGVWGM